VAGGFHEQVIDQTVWLASCSARRSSPGPLGGIGHQHMGLLWVWVSHDRCAENPVQRRHGCGAPRAGRANLWRAIHGGGVPVLQNG
jgi:hypothetical protein